MGKRRRSAAAALLAVGLASGAFSPAAIGGDVPELNPLSGDQKAIREGRSWYRNVCANCHGGRADGQGERGTGADLRKFDKGFREFVNIVHEGRQVAGRIQGMPGWKGVLKEEDIYRIAAYLETLAVEGSNWKEATSR